MTALALSLWRSLYLRREAGITGTVPQAAKRFLGAFYGLE